MRNKELKQLYWVWWEMKRRCTDPKSKQYKDYGQRGISVSHEWHSFDIFLKDMGCRPKGASIERIDNNKGYSKENCKWSTDRSEQCLNRRMFKCNKLGIKNVSVREVGYRVRIRRQGEIVIDCTVHDFFEACCIAKVFEGKPIHKEI